MYEKYKNSYKVTEKELVSLSVYNVGFQRCDSLYHLNLIMNLNVSWNHNIALSLCYLYCSVKFLILQSEIGKDKAFVLE